MNVCNKQRMKRVTKLHRYMNISRYSIVTKFMYPVGYRKSIYEPYFVAVRISINDDNVILNFKMRSGNRKDLRKTRTAWLHVPLGEQNIKSVLLSKSNRTKLDETLGAFVFGSNGLRLIDDFAKFGWEHIVQNLDVDKIIKRLLYQMNGV